MNELKVLTLQEMQEIVKKADTDLFHKIECIYLQGLIGGEVFEVIEVKGDTEQ